jgi:3-mercaptopyruvate sulfurtransferase SseA
VALRLRELGFHDAYALTGGFDAWKAGHPVEPLRRADAPAENAAAHQPL